MNLLKKLFFRKKKAVRIVKKPVINRFKQKIIELEPVFKEIDWNINPLLEWIVLHHSLTKDSKTVSWDAIKKWHMGLFPDSPYKDNPMSDIGYHFGVELVFDKIQPLMGRSLNKTGGHAKGFNNKSIGICNVGNYDITVPDGERWFMTLALCSVLLKKMNRPVERVIGHWQVYELLGEPIKKTCPGINWSMFRFVQDLKFYSI